MEIRRISFFDEFNCIGGECRLTCCKGWLIPIEPEDIERFKKEKPVTRFILFATRFGVRPAFNKRCGTCVFHDGKGLCRLQKRKGHEFLPEVCRGFPRYYRNYGAVEEHYVDISCIHAAKLLLDNFKSMKLIVSDDEPEAVNTAKNNEPEYFDWLDKTRSEMLVRLQNTTDFAALKTLLSKLLKYFEDMHDAILSVGADYLPEHPIGEYLDSGESVRDVFPFDVNANLALFDTSFYSNVLKKTLPELYALCALYFKRQADVVISRKQWSGAVERFEETHPEAAEYIAAYFSYFLLQHFFESYADYGFMRKIREGLIHANMILLFDVLYFIETGDFDRDRQIRIMSVYNRRPFFNREIRKEMYEAMGEWRDFAL